MTEQVNRSMTDLFAQSQETYEDARKKSADESGSKTQRFKMDKDGTYAIRILPLAPSFDADGNALPMDRKGYEYPIKSLFLKIKNKEGKGKAKDTCVNVCHTKFVYPELKADLIDTFTLVALEKYADDKAVCKKIKESGFSGGLKWSSGRSMYIFDADDKGRKEGIQLLNLSYTQYKDLEDRKIKLWEKLLKQGKCPCPISSIKDAYIVEITRKTDNSNTAYTLNIDSVSGKDELSEEELQSLFDAPRLPEVIYRYTQYHLEATITYLNQYEEALQIDVMSDERIKDCIDKIKMSLPADDNSHFNGNSSQDNEESTVGINTLWDEYDRLIEEGLDDRSEEGQNLRTSIREFIEDNELNVKVSRGKTNKELLQEIEDELGDSEDQGDNTQQPAEPEQPEEEKTEAKEPDTTEEPANRRSRRNDDTNEPAVHSERRSARPERRARQ